MEGSKAVFLLSGETTGLPEVELRALLETYGFTKLRVLSPRLYAVDGCEKAERVAERGAHVRVFGHHLSELSLPELLKEIPRMEFSGIPGSFRSFRVSVTKLLPFSPFGIEEKIAHRLKELFPESKVSLESPDLILHSILFSSRSGGGMELGEEDIRTVLCFRGPEKEKKWKQRRPRSRPFFHPAALFPKLARTMVNLARVREDEIVLDPFCGTGSILLEAELMGLLALGSDLSKKMCRGAKANLLAFFEVPSSLIVMSDALLPPFSSAQGICSDLPYGRCSSTLGRSEEGVLDQFLNVSKDLLQRERFCVIMHRAKFERCEGYELVERSHIPVHKSLTRVISVLRRI